MDHRWLTLTEAAEHFGCVYITLLRNWPVIPRDDRRKHGRSKFVWSGTRWRPNRMGRPTKTYGGRTLLAKVREALPDCPHDLSTLAHPQREAWMGKIDAVLEG